VKLSFFGDSYDIVKQCLINWLSFGEWLVHPMFTEPVSPEAAAEYSRFLGASLLSVEVLTPKTDRSQYFGTCHTCGHLFLDPDTGLWIKRARPARALRDPVALSGSVSAVLTFPFVRRTSLGIWPRWGSSCSHEAQSARSLRLGGVRINFVASGRHRR